MGGQFRENWKRLTNQFTPKNIPTAMDEKDVLRVEDVNGLANLTPSDGTLLVGSGTSWVTLPLGANGLVLKSVGGTAQWAIDASGVASAPIDLSASGFVVGPPSSINNAIAIYDGTTGKLIKVANATIDDFGNLNIGGNTIISGDLTVLGNTNLGNVTITGTIINQGPTIVSVASGNTSIFNITNNNLFNAIQSGVTLVTMPPIPILGQQHIIKDISGTAAASNIVVDGSGNTIDGQNTTTLNNNYQSVTLIFGPTEWNII